MNQPLKGSSATSSRSKTVITPSAQDQQAHSYRRLVLEHTDTLWSVRLWAAPDRTGHITWYNPATSPGTIQSLHQKDPRDAVRPLPDDKLTGG